MSVKKLLGRFFAAFTAVAILMSVTGAFNEKVSAAKNKTAYFAYRLDVMDDKKANDDCVALQVLSSIDGAVYAYIKHNGDSKPSVKDIMDSGYKTLVPANEETDAYGHIYWLDEIVVGEKYDIYIVFEDVAHNTYGPYVEKGWKASYFPAGNGTKKNPYQIWTTRHLYNMDAFTGENYKGTYFKLMQDIDLSECIYTGRIMDYSSTFYGIFDGNGKTIRHLNGIFFDNLAATAIVRDLYLADADADYSNNGFDGILAESNKGLIEKCAVVNSKLRSASSAGIIVGENLEDGIIKNCAVVDCSLKVSDNNGGIVGRNFGTIKDCYAKIDCVSDYSCGGIVGRHDKGTISGCLGDISVTARSENGHPNVAGISGYFEGTDAYIKDCVSLYVPEEGSGYGKTASIWATCSNYEYLENTSGNVGAVSYTDEDIKLTDDEINGTTDEEQLESRLTDKKERWQSQNGESSTSIENVKNPAQKVVDAVDEDGKNAVKISSLKIKYKHIYENETAAYNKKFKMKQAKLSVKSYSALGKVKIKKVKVDEKNDQVTISWNKVKKAEGYIIYRAVWSSESSENGGKYGEYEEYKVIESPNTTEYVNKYLYPNKIYYYRIRAYYTTGGKKVLGAYSDIKEVTYSR